MPDLSPDIVEKVLAACQAGAAEAAAALSRALDAEFSLSVGEPDVLPAETLPEELKSPGLAVVISVGTGGAVLLLPESTGLLPGWYGSPDPTGQSKLTTLAQELGMVLLPEEYMAEDFKSGRVENLSEALERGGLAGGVAKVPLEIKSKDGQQGVALLVWPVSRPGQVLAATSRPSEATTAGVPFSAASASPPSSPPASPAAPSPSFKPKSEMPSTRSGKRELPFFTRSLLHVKIPVVVTLATKKQSVGQIIELGPGQIIQFEKSCEEMLDMEAGGCRIAAGEAIKIGDKFGLRVNSIILPDERFLPVEPNIRKK
jgi:flagellar motor switch/type III secretory pathway protein FliN